MLEMLPPCVGTGAVWMWCGGACAVLVVCPVLGLTMKDVWICAVLGLNVKDVGAVLGPIGPLHTDPV